MSEREGVLAALVMELASDLEGEITARFGGAIHDHPYMQKRFKRDMAIVERARKFVRDSGLDHHSVFFLKDNTND